MIVIDPKTKTEYLISTSKSHGEESMTCPSCSEGRKKKSDKCFSYNHEKQVGRCNHCGIALVEKKEVEFKKEYQIPPKWENKTSLSDKLVKHYSEKRGLHQETLLYFKVGEGMEYMPQLGKEANTIQFPYIRNGEIVNIKYKTADKKFKMFKDAELILFNVDSIKDKKVCLFTEGEEDAMAVRQAGVEEVVSVPNGATTGKINMEYIDNCIEYFLDPEMKIYLGTDDDLPGRNLQEQLAERFGKERCYKVKWKESKDANECLLKFGAGGIIESIEAAKPYPLEGITTISDYDDEVNDIYVNGLPKGAKTKMSNLNELIEFHKGYFTVITGIPNQGKTSFLDQLCLHLSLVNNWKGAFYSPENKPTSLHISNLCRKLIGKAWWGENRITPKEIAIAKEFLNNRFYFVTPEKGFGLDSILKHVRRLKESKGIDFFVIDAWNKLEHKHGGDENAYIGQSLDLIDNFCNYNKLHLFLVAHPRKMMKRKDSQAYEVPTAYDVNGSANFYNKPDINITVYRDYEESETRVYVQKVKFDHWGKQGFCRFKYDPESGRFNEYYGGMENFDRYPWIYEQGNEQPPMEPDVIPF